MGVAPSNLPVVAEEGPSGKSQAPAPSCPMGFEKKQNTGVSSDAADAPTALKSTATATECPVKNSSTSSSSEERDGVAVGTDGAGTSRCPVKEEDRAGVAKYLHPHKYNVYSQRIDVGAEVSSRDASEGQRSWGEINPNNNMPSNLNQQPAPSKEAPLSTDRVKSTIPKGGEETTWTYPSPQMFWNALTRKGKAEGTEERDMNVVVSIHNNMNERTWKKILEWEKLRTSLSLRSTPTRMLFHNLTPTSSTPRSRLRGLSGAQDVQDGTEPRLLRFQGRPDDITPKALVKMMLGNPLPFDRHDWIVDRGGNERRYVIDYYHDEGAPDGDEVPKLHSEGAVKSIKVDVRPALDGFSDLADRLVMMPMARLMGKSNFDPLPLLPSPTMKSTNPGLMSHSKKRPADLTEAARQLRQGQQGAEQGGTTPSTDEAAVATLPPAQGNDGSSERDARALARMAKKCAKPLQALREADGIDDVSRAEAAALKLEFCTARYLCKKEANAYKEALAYADAAGPAHMYWAESAVEARLSDMRAALARFTERLSTGGVDNHEELSES